MKLLLVDFAARQAPLEDRTRIADSGYRRHRAPGMGAKHYRKHNAGNDKRCNQQLAAHHPPTRERHTAPRAAADVVVELGSGPADAELLALVTDPVCGMEIAPSSAAASDQVGVVRYYF